MFYLISHKVYRFLAGLTAATGLLIFLLSPASVIAQPTKAELQEEAKEFIEFSNLILQDALDPLVKDGTMTNADGLKSMYVRETYIGAEYRFHFKVPGADKSQKYSVTLYLFNALSDSEGAAARKEAAMAEEVFPSKFVGVNEKLPGEGSLELGDRSYYSGVRSGANERTTYILNSHTSFLQYKDWMVVIVAETYKPDWNESIKARQKELLERILEVLPVDE